MEAADVDGAPPEPGWTREMVPHFPVDSYTPHSPCAHRGPYPRGSRLYCPQCHASGMDDSPSLKRDPRYEPRPDPKPVDKPARQTRKQRRKQGKQPRALAA